MPNLLYKYYKIMNLDLTKFNFFPKNLAIHHNNPKLLYRVFTYDSVFAMIAPCLLTFTFS